MVEYVGVPRRFEPSMPDGRYTATLFGLFAIYVALYLASPVLPGNHPQHPEGWWEWWDQSAYLRSARALASLDFSPDSHWYPFGYGLLAAPFVPLMPTHPFFIVDAAALLCSLHYFAKIGNLFGVGKYVCLSLFVLAFATDKVILGTIIVPWNTTATMFYVIAALYYSIADRRPGYFEFVVIGVCFVATAATRPGDVVMFLPIGAALSSRILRSGDIRSFVGPAGAGVAVAGALVCAYVWLHLRVYGRAPSQYMVNSAAMGFDARYLVEKLYAILIDPVPLYDEGRGVMQNLPWFVLSVPTLLFGAARWGWRWIVAASVAAVNVLFYTAYVDLIPHNMWMYMVVHYFNVTLPILALAAWGTIEACFTRQRFIPIVAVVIAAMFSVKFEYIDDSVAEIEVRDERTLRVKGGDDEGERIFVIEPVHMTESQITRIRRSSVGGENVVHYADFRILLVGNTIRVVSSVPFNKEGFEIEFEDSHGYSAEQPPRVRVLESRLVPRWW